MGTNACEGDPKMHDEAVLNAENMMLKRELAHAAHVSAKQCDEARVAEKALAEIRSIILGGACMACSQKDGWGPEVCDDCTYNHLVQLCEEGLECSAM